jgi:hypothetical protein
LNNNRCCEILDDEIEFKEYLGQLLEDSGEVGSLTTELVDLIAFGA